jgi:hypothetical protein
VTFLGYFEVKMGTNSKETAARKLIGKFARTLLASTCLTAASSGAAMASTVYPPFPSGENPTVQSPLTVLLADPNNPGATIVTVSQTQSNTWFELTGLGLGTLTFDATSTGTLGDSFNFCTDATFLSCAPEGSASLSAPLNLPSMAIPGSRNLFIHTTPVSEQANSYTVTVNTQAPQVPEPSTSAMAGLGLATLITLSRKKR